MLRGTLTLLTRSLRDAARQRRGHAFRIVSILVACGMLIEAHVTGAKVGAPGLRFFEWLCDLNFVLITLAGISYFAGVITEEKEDGTLGLLKLADLSTLSILLGKSTSRLVTALIVFAGQFPFALLALTLGGVTAHQVVSGYVALAAYMVLLANLALVFSIVCRRTGTASISMLCLLLVCLGLTSYLQAHRPTFVLAGYGPDASSAAALLWALVEFVDRHSIMTRLQVILETGFDESALSTQVWINIGLALVLFVVCWAVFDRFTEYVQRTDSPRGILPRIKGRRFVRVFRTWPAALAWKDFHFVAGGPVIAGIKLLAYPLLVLAIYHQSDLLVMLTPLSVADSAWLAVLVMGTIELLVCATRIFRQERQEGTLPTLLLLPRGTARIAYAKVAGCLLGSLPTLLLVTVLYVTLPQPVWVTEFFVEERYAALVVVFVVLLHLTAFYSLIVRWGALPLAVATLIVLGSCGAPVLFSAVQAVAFTSEDEFAKLGPVLYTGGIIVTVLQILIGIRIRAVAAQ